MTNEIIDTDNQGPTLRQAILQMVAVAVKDKYITADGSRVMLSIDSLTQLGCVPVGTEEAITAILSRAGLLR